MRHGWTSDEEERLARELAGGADAPRCPRCGERLERRSVEPRGDVAYVRDRIWLVCGGCDASGVLDRREVERRRSRPGTAEAEAEGGEGTGDEDDD